MIRRITSVLKVFISIGLVVYLFYLVDYKILLLVFSEANIFYLGLAILFFLLSWVVNTLKWQFLLHQIGIAKNYLTLLRIQFISIFYSVVLPGGQLTGEVVKCVRITKDHQEKDKLISSIVMDRITGVVSMILIGSLSILCTTNEITYIRDIKIIFFLLLTFISIFVFSVNSEICESLVIKTLNHFRSNRFIIILQLLTKIIFNYKKRYAVLYKSIILSCIYFFLVTTCVFLLSLSLDIKIGFVDLLWINALVSALTIIPITVLGIGLRESSFVVILALIKIPSEQALALSFSVTALTIFSGLIGGMLDASSLFKKTKDNCIK